jgi:hypothetical protein
MPRPATDRTEPEETRPVQRCNPRFRLGDFPRKNEPQDLASLPEKEKMPGFAQPFFFSSVETEDLPSHASNDDSPLRGKVPGSGGFLFVSPLTK